MKALNRERGNDRENQRRIQAAGIPIAVDTNHTGLLIQHDVEAYDSTIFDLDGGAGLIVPVRIIPTTGVFFLTGVSIALNRWPEARFRPLEENWRGVWPHYEFYGRSDYKFHRSEVMNQLIADRKEIRPGHLCAGLLLAVSADPMPAEFGRGEFLSGSITVYDQFGREHVGKVSLRVHREVERVRQPDPRRRRLLALPDPKRS
jgi:hypothetical protein